MKRKQHSGVFMMEMIMVVFFFIICASICILVFVKGDRMSREAMDLNRSVLIAQSVAEVWKEEGGEGLENRFGARDIGSGRYIYTMGFDKNGNRAESAGDLRSDSPAEAANDGVQEENVIYAANLAASGLYGEAEITVSRDGENIYTLLVARHEQ